MINKNWHYWNREEERARADLEILEGKPGLVAAFVRMLCRWAIKACQYEKREVTGQNDDHRDEEWY